VKRLKLWHKLAGMGTVLMFPFALVTSKMISSINTLGVDFARQEIRGLEYYRPLLSLLEHLQQHRGMANAARNGSSSFDEQLAATSAALASDLSRIDLVDQRLGSALQVSERWDALKADCRALVGETANLSSTELFALHTTAIRESIDLITAVGDGSNLTLDPDLDSYYLMNVLIFEGPQLSEMLATARGVGSGIAARRSGTAEEFAMLNRLAILAESVQEQASESMRKALASNPALAPQLEEPARASATAVAAAASEIARQAVSGKITGNAADYYSSITRTVDRIFETEDRIATVLHGLLERRVDRYRDEMLRNLGEACLGLLLAAAIGFLIVRDITSALQQSLEIADQIATGDLRTAAMSRRDEFGAALASMVERLSALVGQVHKSGTQIGQSVTEIAATAKEQQATAHEVAATTVQIGTTSRAISATSRELVDTMNEVATVAAATADLAGSGQQGLSRMGETMRHVMEAAASINAKLGVLNEKAGNINQVVTTITKVADQTNLLSLNAAIEAEKAGEYGRGFAVVAMEIRRLADQTAVATFDIEQMVKEIHTAVSAGVMGMDKFSEQVRSAIQEVQQVGGQLSQIIQQVQAITPRFEAVNQGMQGQTYGAEQITLALTQLSESARQTVDSLGHSNRSIEELTLVSNSLLSSVECFRLEG
jgi:methyl-accepting chemotaxis protein